jgi:hypothetical protein
MQREKEQKNQKFKHDKKQDKRGSNLSCSCKKRNFRDDSGIGDSFSESIEFSKDIDSQLLHREMRKGINRFLLYEKQGEFQAESHFSRAKKNPSL